MKLFRNQKGAMTVGMVVWMLLATFVFVAPAIKNHNSDNPVDLQQKHKIVAVDPGCSHCVRP